MITHEEVIEIIDFLSGRLGVNELEYDENRDDVIADTFEFVEGLHCKKKSL